MTSAWFTRVGPISIMAGIVVAQLVVGAALLLLAAQPQQWSATSSLVVIPKSANTDRSLAASLYDVLSRGQVPATFAELLRGRSLEVEAARRQGMTAAEAQDVSLEVVVVPETSVLDLTVTATEAEVAEQVATEVQVGAETYLASLDTPYKVVGAADAAGTARKDGLSPLPLAAVVIIVAVVAGVAVQQAIMALSRAHGVRAESARPPTPRAQMTTVRETLPGPELPGEMAETG